MDCLLDINIMRGVVLVRQLRFLKPFFTIETNQSRYRAYLSFRLFRPFRLFRLFYLFQLILLFLLSGCQGGGSNITSGTSSQPARVNMTSSDFNLFSPLMTGGGMYHLLIEVNDELLDGLQAECLFDNQTVSASIEANMIDCPLEFQEDGVHTINLAVTRDGSEPYVLAVNITRDTLPPVIDLSSLTSYDSNSSQMLITIEDLTNVTANYSLAKGAAISMRREGDSYVVDLPDSLGTGRHTLEVRAVDALGNEATESASFVLLVDSPSLNLTSANVTNDMSYSLEATIDSGSYEGAYTGAWCLLTGRQIVASIDADRLSCNLVLGDLPDGSHLINVSLQAAYQTGEDTYDYTFSLLRDTTGPEIDLSSLAPSYDALGETILVGISDALSEVASAHYRFNGDEFQSLVKQGNTYPVALSDSLGTGRHTIEIQAVDSLGNEATKSASFVLLVDSPTLDLTSENVTNSLSYSLAATIDSGSYEGEYTGGWCLLAGRRIVASIGSDSLSCNLALGDLPDGSHLVEVFLQTDEDTYDYTFSLLKDTTGPEIDLSSLAASYDGVEEAILVGISDALSEVASAHYRFNGDEFQSLVKQGDAYSAALSDSLGTGRHSIEVRALDSLGNEATKSASFVLLRDRPTLDLTSENVTNSLSYSLAATIDSGSYEGEYTGGWCLLAGQRIVANISSDGLSCNLALASLAEGSHFVEVSLQAAYQTGEDTYDYTFSLLKDTTGPEIDLSSLAASYDGVEEAILVGISDTLSEVASAHYRFNGDEFQSLVKQGETYPVALSDSLATGRHNIEVRAADSLGNEATKSASFVLLVDSPTLNLTSANATNRGAYSLEATIDSGSYEGEYTGGWCLLASQRIVANISSDGLSCNLALASLADGSHDIEVSLQAAYQTGEDTYDYTFSLLKDTTGPEIDLSSLAPSYDGLGEAISVGISDTLSEVASAHYRFDDGELQSLVKQGETYPAALSDSLGTGRHSIEVRAVDVLGNEATESASFVLSVDSPTLNLTSANATNSGTYRLAATIDSGSYEGEYTGECLLAGRRIVANISSDGLSCNLALASLAEGSHDIEVSLQAAYQTGEDTYDYTFSLLKDTTGPEIDLSSLAASYDGVEEAILVGISDTLSEVASAHYRFNGDEFQSLVKQGDAYSAALSDSLGTGRHSIEVRAADSLGNEATKSASFVLLVDSPTLNLTSANATNSGTYRLEATIDSGSYEGEYTGVCLLASQRIVANISSDGLSCDLVLAGLMDGLYMVEVLLTATEYGRTYSSSIPLLRDTQPPTISLPHLQDLYRGGDVSILILISDRFSTIKNASYRLGSEAAIPLTEQDQGRYEFSLPPFIATGQYRLVVRAVDELGNEQTAEDSFVVLRDDPQLNLTSPALSAKRTYRLTADLDPGTYTGDYTASCRLEGGTISEGSEEAEASEAEVAANRLSCPLVFDVDGPYKAIVTLTAVDLAEVYGYIFDLVYDSTPPSVDLSAVARQYDGSESAQRLTITDSYAEVTTADWRIGQLAAGVLARIGTSDEWSFVMPVSSLPTGAHSIEFNLSDSLGNYRLYMHDFLVLKDRPTVQLTSADRTNLNSYDLRARIDAGSYLGTYTGTCNLNGDLGDATIVNNLLSCQLNLVGLIDGGYPLAIVLTADYEIDYEYSLVFTVDRTAPSIQLLNLAEVYGADYDGQVVEALILDSSDISRVDYQLDDGTIEVLTGTDDIYSFTLPASLTTGRHWLTLTATDSLGNKNVIRRPFLILRDAPRLSQTSQPLTRTHYYNFTATIDPASYPGDYSGSCSVGGQAEVEATIASNQLSCNLDLWSLANGVQPIEVNLTANYDRSYDFVLRVEKDVDVDRDDDGLIEVTNAIELDEVRYQLNGSGKRTVKDMRLNMVGCPLGGCNGYELIDNISLAEFPNWRPIGQDGGGAIVGPFDIECSGEPFSGIFEGNGNRISGLRIDRPTEGCVGLFGSINRSVVRNFNLAATSIRGGDLVGSLAGNMNSVAITDVAVVVHQNLSGSDHIGGLVGRAAGGRIVSSSVAASHNINGSDYIGGLVGSAEGARILSSYAATDTIAGIDHVGGLVGDLIRSSIYYSYALFNEVRGDAIGTIGRSGGDVGGLVGNSGYSTLIASYAKGHRVQGVLRVGGLVGSASIDKVIHSTAAIGEIRGGTQIGGLIGKLSENSYLSSSYAVTKKISAAGSVFGPLMGDRDSPLGHRLTHSYWDRTAVNISRDESLFELLGITIVNLGLAEFNARNRPTPNYYDETAQRSQALRSPVDYTGIYSRWDQAVDIDFTLSNWANDLFTGTDPITRWCDTNADGSIDESERQLDNRIWDFGGRQDYPRLHCPPQPPAWVAQRFPLLFEDTDGDFIVDYLDQFAGIECSELADCDGDGVNDGLDPFPMNASEWADEDNDGVGSNTDIDDDGDGLIEIATMDELHWVRYQLDGSGKRRSLESPLDQTGCGDGESTKICIGYELVTNISLASLDEGFSWQPLGHDIDPSRDGCQGEGLGGMFEGNGNRITGLVINRRTEDCLGLFGNLGSLAHVRNLHLEVDRVSGDDYVGGMAAYGYGAKLRSSSVVFNTIEGDGVVGGLIGYASNMELAGLTSIGRNLNASSSKVGGLVGEDGNSAIHSSSARVDSIRGGTNVGGLVGEGINTRVTSSFSFAGLIDGDGKVGGLVGYTDGARVIASYGISDSLSADTWTSSMRGGSLVRSSGAGGLIGRAVRTNVVYSYAVAGSISGTGDHVSGLIGDGHGHNSLIFNSYAVSGSLRQSSIAPLMNGLVKGGSAAIANSYWDSTVSGISGLAGDDAAQSTSQLQSPTGYSGVYESWDDTNNGGVSPWCDKNLNGQLDSDERRPDNLIWNFGSRTQYPAIRCTPDATVLQRSGWQLSGGKPVINDNVFDLDGDTDGDGVEDSRDLFPGDPTENSDKDGDNIGDNKDNCPLIANFAQEDMDGDGHGDLCDTDKDGDGYTDTSDNCPFDFNPSQRDTDRDDQADACDLDFDGDGLIEIATAAELDAIRYQLDGTGRRTAEDMPLNRAGCPRGGCSGYELISHINLTDYITAPEGWQPIGGDTNRDEEGCQGEGFSSVFEGNGRTLSGLRIARPAEDCVGLFGHIKDGELRNLEVEATNISGKNRVGVLAGFATSATILATDVSSARLSGEGSSVGGLIGHLSTGRIVSTSAVVSSQLAGGNQVGGFIGYGLLSTIRHSSALSNNIGGQNQVGGLIGNSQNMRISHSMAFFNELSGGIQLGGLIGRCSAPSGSQLIVASLARFSLIDGDSDIGGLMGDCDDTQIVSSMASGVDLVGGPRVGGLVGTAVGITLASSYTVVSDIQGTSDTNGLIGIGVSLRIDDSYWALRTLDPSLDAFGRTILEIQYPTQFSGIYASWDDGVDLNRDGNVEATTRWCDTNHDGIIGSGEKRADNLIWNLGRSDEYPTLNCIPEISPRQKELLPELFGDKDGDGIANAFDIGAFGSRDCKDYADCDGDGVNDNLDAFPTNPNEQTDTDGDIVGDNLDNCANVFNPDQLNTDGDPYGDACDADRDGDGSSRRVDNCPLLYNPSQRNRDSDAYGDACDLDRDGDGLIEIFTAAELNAVRYELNASGRRLAQDGPLDTVGCGNGRDVLDCDGYELAADIDLAAYADGDGGKGWQPLGYDDDSETDGCQGTSFNQIFDGNDFTILNLHIARAEEDCVGLFGRLGGDIRNLALANADLEGNVRVGLLAGEADEASITTITIASSRVDGAGDYVGGLVGKLSAATVEAVFVSANVSGWSRVGGVIGESADSSLSHMSFTGDEVDGTVSYIGGLVGWAQETDIMDSIVLGAQVDGVSKIGGAVGILRQSSMFGSAALTSQVIGSSTDVGGLIGEAWQVTLAKSAAFSGRISGTNNIGGLIGKGQDVKLFFSLAVSHEISRTGRVGGLIGFASGGNRDDSYWDSIAGLSNDGHRRTTQELQSPTGYTGIDNIYNNWDNRIDFDNDDGDGQIYTGEEDDNTRWCDTNYDGEIDGSEKTSANYIWDLGTSSDYPTLRCTPVPPEQQREFIESLDD